MNKCVICDKPIKMMYKKGDNTCSALCERYLLEEFGQREFLRRKNAAIQKSPAKN